MKTETKLKRLCEEHKLRIEERYEHTGFVYFGKDSRVFWSYDPTTDEIVLRQGWGWPTDKEVWAIQQALALRLTLPIVKPA